MLSNAVQVIPFFAEFLKISYLRTYLLAHDSIPLDILIVGVIVKFNHYLASCNLKGSVKILL